MNRLKKEVKKMESEVMISEVKLKDVANLPALIPIGSSMDSPQVLAHLSILATMYSKSELVPKHYRNKPAETLIALDSARQLGVPAMQYLQATHVIHGKQGMEASLMVSLARRGGGLKGVIKYETEHTEEDTTLGIKNIRIRAWAVEKGTDDELFGPWVDLKMAIAEGWARSNPKYKSMPEVMLEKRAATFFVRRFFPECLNGLSEIEELVDLGGKRQVTVIDADEESIDLLENTNSVDDVFSEEESDEIVIEVEPIEEKPKTAIKPKTDTPKTTTPKTTPLTPEEKKQRKDAVSEIAQLDPKNTSRMNSKTTVKKLLEILEKLRADDIAEKLRADELSQEPEPDPEEEDPLNMDDDDIMNIFGDQNETNS